MVSLEEAKQQIEDLKLRIDSISMDYHDLREVEVSMIRIGAAVEKLTGSKEINQAIGALNRLIWTIRMAQISINALEVAEGPIGWLYAGATVLATATMAITTVSDMGGG